MKPSAPFIFKQFAVRQPHAAFKVGTDSVLLGSWVNLPSHASCIVDAGTGTGILALMMAQRSSAMIHAVEIDPLSARDAECNFQSSPWNNRITLHTEDLTVFASHTSIRADLFITNPPYFNHSLKSSDTRTKRARHTGDLSFRSLWQVALQVMHSDATLALILPVKEMETFAQLGETFEWYIHRSCRVSSFEHSPPIRMMAEFRQGKAAQTEEARLYLYEAEGNRSAVYQLLTADFYL